MASGLDWSGVPIGFTLPVFDTYSSQGMRAPLALTELGRQGTARHGSGVSLWAKARSKLVRVPSYFPAQNEPS